MTLAADVANRALEGETWAREKLAPHAGRVLRFDIGPARTALAIDAEGRFAASDAMPDLIVKVSPLNVPALLAEPSRWGELAAVEGDASLASTLAELAPTLPWFVERLLGRALGPIAGQQLADAGRYFLTLPGYAAERISDSVARYVGDEARLAVRAGDARNFAEQVAALSARVDSLATRVAALAP
jgi:ubiquinone biosynthesis protein UbiJ